MADLNTDIVAKIREILVPLCADIDDYQGRSIEELVKHFEELGKGKVTWRWLSYDELTSVKAMNNIRDWIKIDLIENDYKKHYVGYASEAKNDFELGVLAAISLIEHRVHCICDI